MKNKKLHLYWLDDVNSDQYSAGVAFREEEYGEYRLKIDSWPERRLYLKAVKTDNERIDYRVEEVIKIKSEFIRISIGFGYGDKGTNHNVIIHIAPHLRERLILSFEEER